MRVYGGCASLIAALDGGMMPKLGSSVFDDESPEALNMASNPVHALSLHPPSPSLPLPAMTIHNAMLLTPPPAKRQDTGATKNSPPVAPSSAACFRCGRIGHVMAQCLLGTKPFAITGSCKCNGCSFWINNGALTARPHEGSSDVSAQACMLRQGQDARFGVDGFQEQARA